MKPARDPRVQRLRADALRWSLGILATLMAAAVPAQQAPRVPGARTLVIAQIVPRSGPLANVGSEVAATTKAAIDDFNRQRPDVQINLVVEDDGNVAERSSALASAAPREIMAYLSCFGTVGCLAQSKVAQARRVPLVGPIAGAASLRGAQAGMSFALRASAADEVRTLLTYAQTNGLRRIGVLVQDDGFGRAYAAELDRLASQFADLDLRRLTLNPAQPDHAYLAAEIQRGTPSALLLLANAAHSTAFLNAWREKAALPFVFNLAGQANALFSRQLKGYTGAAAFVTVTPSPWGRRTELQREYQRVAQEAKLPLSYLGFEAFANARLLIDSVLRSGARNAGELTRYLEALPARDIGGISVEYALNRRGGHFTDMALLRSDGSFVH